MNHNNTIALIPTEPTAALLEAYRTAFQAGSRADNDVEIAHSPQYLGLAAVLELLRLDTGDTVRQLHNMLLGAQIGATLSETDEERRTHRLYAEQLSLLMLSANLEQPRPAQLEQGMLYVSLSGETLHYAGLPVAVHGIVGTHPNNWPLIRQFLETGGAPPETAAA